MPEDKKKKKKKKKSSKKSKDPFSVFDPGRRLGKGEKIPEAERAEIIRQDKLKLAKRYEAIKLFDESIKYYRQIGMDDEADRVIKKKTELYSERAVEFENEGRYAEAAELYERLNDSEKAGVMRRRGGIKDNPPYNLDLRYSESEETDTQSGAQKMETAKNVRWEMPNVEVEGVGQGEGPPPSKLSASDPARDNTGTPDESQEPIPLETSQDLVKSAEADERSAESASHGGKTKAFSICPYCGEDLNLPKQPKFCPFCREPFA